MRSLSTRQRAFATVGIMLALFLASLDQSIVNPALPRIAADLNGISLYAWVATSYMVASAVFVPISGKLGDMFGRKPFTLVGIIGFVGGSALCGLSQNMTQLIAFRGLQGVFGGILMASAFTVLADIYTVEQRTRMQGLFGAVFGLSTMIGPTLGGSIVDGWGWRWIFYVNVPVGVVAVLVTLAALPYVRSSANWRDIDFLGVVTLAGGLVPMLLGLSITTNHAWTSAPVLTLLIGGAIVLCLFFLVEIRYARNPIVPFGLFRSNQFSVMVGVAFFSGVGMFGALTFVQLLYQDGLGLDATTAGNLLIPMVGMLIPFSAVTGQIATRIRYYRFLCVFGMAVVMIGLLLLSRATPETSQWTIMAYTMLVGAGLGISFPLTTAVVQAALPRKVVGVGTSQIQFWRSVGGTIGLAVLGSIEAHQLTGDIQTRVAALHLPRQLLPVERIAAGVSLLGPAAISKVQASLPPAARQTFEATVAAVHWGFADAVHSVFVIGAAAVAIALVISFFLKEVPLSDKARAALAERASGPTGDQTRQLRVLLAATGYLALRREGAVPQPMVELLSSTLNDYLSNRSQPEPSAPVATNGNGRAGSNGAAALGAHGAGANGHTTELQEGGMS